jgi:hypothetical protein
MVWLSIETIFHPENLLYLPGDIHGIRHFGPNLYNKYEMVTAQSDQAAHVHDFC